MTPKFPRIGFDDNDDDRDGLLPSGDRPHDPLKAKAEGEERRILDVLLKFSAKLNGHTESEAVLDEILDSIVELEVAERVFIVMKRGENFDIMRHRDPLVGKYKEEYATVSQTIVRDCFAANDSRIMNDLSAFPEIQASRSVRELGIRAAACFPLRDRNQPFGVLYLDSQKPLPKISSSVRLLEGYAFVSSLALTLLHEVESATHLAEKLRKERDEAIAKAEGEWARELVGQSPAWVDVLRQIMNAREFEHTVLIEGESGTGKELIAQAIAKTSPRRKDGPFIALNCAGLESQLLDATLFGTVKGAFTGAVDRPGYVEAANGGTLFLDEIGDMSMDVQQHFLRFLDNQQFRRLGSLELLESDVRIVAATNRSLKALTQQGRFRSDLYNRINQFRIPVPPLRRRLDDVPLLVNHFLKSIGRSFVEVAPDAIELMRSYEWPGNVRQLRTAIEIAALSAGDSRLITRSDIEKRAGIAADDILPPPPRTLEAARGQAERELVIQSWRRNKGDKSKMATEMGVSRMTVYNLITRHELTSKELDGPAARGSLDATEGDRDPTSR